MLTGSSLFLSLSPFTYYMKEKWKYEMVCMKNRDLFFLRSRLVGNVSVEENERTKWEAGEREKASNITSAQKPKYKE